MFLGIDDDNDTTTGLQDDEPCERRGLSGFVRLAVEQSVSMVKLNLLFLLGCIPIVTVPLSLFAMNCVIRRIVRGEPAHCFQDYWKTLWRGWEKGYLAFLLTVPPLGCAGFGMWFYFDRAGENLLFFAPFAVCSTVFLVTLLSSGYLYGLLEERSCAKETVRLLT